LLKAYQPTSSSSYLIDNDKRLYLLLQRLLEDKLSLSHGALSGTDHEAHSIDHIHNTFDLSSEILMAWGIDNIDLVIVIVNAGGFGAE
jgi:hypothetical protein